MSSVWISHTDVSAATVFQRDLRIATSTQIERELSDEVRMLSDSCLTGRAFGTGGACGAAFYIARQFVDAGYELTFQKFMSNGLSGHNIIAVTPGRYTSYIVVGAYYDGYGTVGDTLYPGSDANASGVSAMLTIARHFAAVPPDSSSTGLVFVAFDGHCDDLAGSSAFVDGFGRNLNISMMVNLDTVGSILAPVVPERPDFLIALGGAAYSESLSLANRTVGLHLTYDYYGNRNFTDLFYLHIGDQRAFIENGIPSVMFTSGITLNTNKMTDTPDTLDYKVLASRIRLMAYWISSLLK